jgi:hypothetical protein
MSKHTSGRPSVWYTLSDQERLSCFLLQESEVPIFHYIL